MAILFLGHTDTQNLALSISTSSIFWTTHAEATRQIEKMVTVVGVHDTYEASLKHTNTLKTFNRDAYGGVNV